MKRIALTGGIGSGKSTAALRLRELGATVIDADQLARDVVAVGTPGLAAVIARFGPEMLTSDGALDRAKLGRLVFTDPAALQDLNGIVHPLVRERSAAMIAAIPEDGVLVYDVALLVESAGPDPISYDDVLVVETPLETRIERLAGRGLSEDEARSRMAAQASDEERRAVATVVLDNAGTREELFAQVDAAWEKVGGSSPQPS
jgi:dephospho-CoA kinase